MPVRWDNIRILQAVDRRQERSGGGEVWGLNGRKLMDEVAEEPVNDEGLVRGFLRELEIAAAAGYLTYRVDDLMGTADGVRRSQPYQYLQLIHTFGLTVAGQDRARGIRVVQPIPDPDEDDGRAISGLILQRIADSIADEYTPDQLVTFLVDEAGIGRDSLPAPDTTRPDDPANYVFATLVGLEQGGSDGRRILRGFIGAWLDDRMISGPSDELRTSLVDQLGRRGWYVEDGRLVIGDPTRGQRVNSPVLRDARLAALHPQVVEVAGKLFRDGHPAAAVFETTKAVNTRVQQMSRLSTDGVSMMGTAFKDEQPPIRLADLATQTGRDVQSGYRFLFMGLMQAVRNPPAHQRFGDIQADDALELLGLCSHLMRILDTASPATG